MDCQILSLGARVMVNERYAQWQENHDMFSLRENTHTHIGRVFSTLACSYSHHPYIILFGCYGQKSFGKSAAWSDQNIILCIPQLNQSGSCTCMQTLASDPKN